MIGSKFLLWFCFLHIFKWTIQFALQFIPVTVLPHYIEGHGGLLEQVVFRKQGMDTKLQ
jgi:hypothetical protein